MPDESPQLRLRGWLPGFLLALPLVTFWVIRALIISEPEGQIA